MRSYKSEFGFRKSGAFEVADPGTLWHVSDPSCGCETCSGACNCRGNCSTGGSNAEADVWGFANDYDGDIWATPSTPQVGKKRGLRDIASVGRDFPQFGGSTKNLRRRREEVFDAPDAQRPTWSQATVWGDGWQAPPGWFNGIPVCPCDEAEFERMKQGGAKVKADDPGMVERFHSPAEKCYRVWFANDVAGNQCCFDANGKLINQGPGAGTPDMYNPRFIGMHFFVDVLAFSMLGWKKYHEQGWGPISEDCPDNSGGYPTPVGGFPPAPPHEPNPPKPRPKPDKVKQRIGRQCETQCFNEMLQEFGPSFETDPDAGPFFDDCVDECMDIWAEILGKGWG
jgi:hypothetical protein